VHAEPNYGRQKEKGKNRESTMVKTKIRKKL
jgi:hypothetical protein